MSGWAQRDAERREAEYIETALVDRMAAMLRELEWAFVVDGLRFCGVCGGWTKKNPSRRDKGHAPGCRLRALLDDIERRQA